MSLKTKTSSVEHEIKLVSDGFYTVKSELPLSSREFPLKRHKEVKEQQATDSADLEKTHSQKKKTIRSMWENHLKFRKTGTEYQ